MQALPFPVFPGFSATASLSLSTDGTIPAALWDLARAHDAAAPPDRPARVRIVNHRLRPHAIRAIIASVLVKAAERAEPVTREDLKTHGLREADIDAHFAAAFSLAAATRPHLFALDAA